MTLSQFILSNKKQDRILRHLCFWLFWGGYFTMVRHLNPVVYMATGHFPNFFRSVAEGFFFLVPQTVLIYPLLYFILPKYAFTHRYFAAVVWGIVFFLISMGAHMLILLAIPWDKIPWISTSQLFLTTNSFPQKLHMAYLASLQGGLTGAALAGSVKMFKHYYLKNLRNQELLKENSEAQLRILMAQVHPHFMFNTLNNIYSQAQEESPKSAKMILELSHILRYVLDEGKKNRVPLENELQMIVDYLNLEKIRYDRKLDLHYDFPEKVGAVQIAPLLLLPLVENCFKHGASKMIEDPWINIKAELQKDVFTIKLMNGKKDSSSITRERIGTGIENVKRRLELLYPNKHTITISEETDVFVIDLTLKLGDESLQNEEIVVTPNLDYA